MTFDPFLALRRLPRTPVEPTAVRRHPLRHSNRGMLINWRTSPLFQSGGMNSSVWGAAAHYRQLLQRQHQQLQQHAEDEVTVTKSLFKHVQASSSRAIDQLRKGVTVTQ